MVGILAKWEENLSVKNHLLNRENCFSDSYTFPFHLKLLILRGIQEHTTDQPKHNYAQTLKK